MTINLDQTFGGDGIVTTDFSGEGDHAYSVTVQNDKKIVVVGEVGGNKSGLVRYNTDGSLDSSFNLDGKVDNDFNSLSVVKLQKDKIVVAGVIDPGFNAKMGLARYNSNGSLDTSFSEDGKSSGWFSSDEGEGSYIYSIAVQSDGKILVAGENTRISRASDISLARYNSNGSLDTSFDKDGIVLAYDGLGASYSDKSLTVQKDGKILVTGGVKDFKLLRYNMDGNLDTSFGEKGIATTDFSQKTDKGNSIQIQIDGKILVAGSTHNGTNNDIGLVRYNTDGSLDTSFGKNGKVITDFLSSDDNVSSIAIQGDGKILVALSIDNGNYSDRNIDIGLVRYNTDGSLDTSFGVSGKYSLDIGTYDFVKSMVITTDKIILAATSSDIDSYDPNSDFIVIRLNNTSGTTVPVATTGPNKLIGTAGADTIDGLAGNDTISGLGGNDRLLGSAGDDSINGGAGDDTMIGGTGNDIYIVNSAKDRVTEALNAGTDRIFSTVTYTLPANVEHLTLQGTKAINGNGNTLNNRITGNTAANKINGGGGNDTLIGAGGNDTFLVNPGNDVLTGDAGADKFTYNTNAKFAKTAVGLDTITDFVIAQADKIVLDKTTFPKISSIAGSGFSQKNEFAKVITNTAAATSAADIVYNSATGGLFYNENGTAAGFGTGGQFLTLTNKPVLTASQFIIQA